MVHVSASSDLDQRIIECVDDGLQALGESAKFVIYHYLEKDFELKKDEILEHPKVFKQALTSIFGEEGSKIIEELIVDEMAQTFKLKHKRKPSLVEVVQAIKKRR